ILHAVDLQVRAGADRLGAVAVAADDADADAGAEPQLEDLVQLRATDERDIERVPGQLVVERHVVGVAGIERIAALAEVVTLDGVDRVVAEPERDIDLLGATDEG